MPRGGDRDWREAASCRLVDARLFDPLTRADCGTEWSRGGPYAVVPRLAEAKAVCASCPVAAPCLSEGRAIRASGMRAGLMLDHGDVVRVAS